MKLKARAASERLTLKQLLRSYVEQLEALAEALLDFRGPGDLTAWLTTHS